MTQACSDQLVAFINDEFAEPVGAPAVAADTDLLSTGLIDSFGVMRVIAHVQDQFGVEVPMTDMTLENFGTVEAMCAYIRRARQ